MQIETLIWVQLKGYRLTEIVVNSATQFEKSSGFLVQNVLPEIIRSAKRPAYLDRRFSTSWLVI